MASHQQQQQRISPRKFSEKIALLNQKEQEGTKAFQQIIKEVEETRTRNPLISNQNDQADYLSPLGTSNTNHHSLAVTDQCPQNFVNSDQNIIYIASNDQSNQSTNGSCNSYYNDMPPSRAQEIPVSLSSGTIENNQLQQQYTSDDPYSYNEDDAVIYTTQDGNVNFDNNYFIDQQLGFDSFSATDADNSKKITAAGGATNSIDNGQQPSSIMASDLEGHLAPPRDDWRSNSDSAMNHSFASSLGTSPVEQTTFINVASCSDNPTHLGEQHDLPDLSGVYLQDETVLSCDQYNQVTDQNEHCHDSTQIKDLPFDYEQRNYITEGDNIRERISPIVNDSCSTEYANSLTCGSFNENQYSSLQHQTYEPQCAPMSSRVQQTSKQGYLQAAQETSHIRPKSCKVPGIEICSIEDEHVGGAINPMQISTSNTGSLPNLTNSKIFHSTSNQVPLGSRSSNVSSKHLAEGTRHLETDSPIDEMPKRSRTYYDDCGSDFAATTSEQQRHHQQPTQQHQLPVTSATATQQQLGQNIAYDNRLEQPHQPLLRSSSMTSSSQNSCFPPNENYLCKSGLNKLNNDYGSKNYTVITNGLSTITRSNSHNNLCYRLEQNQQQHHHQLLQQSQHLIQHQQPIQQQHQLDNRLHDHATTTYISQSQDSFCDTTVINGVRYNSPFSGSSAPSPSSDQGSPSSQFSKYNQQQSPQSLTEVSRSNNISPVLTTTWKSASYKDELWSPKQQQMKQMTNCVNDQALNPSFSANSSQQASSVGPCRSPTVFRRSQNHAAYKNIVPASRNHSHHR